MEHCEKKINFNVLKRKLICGLSHVPKLWFESCEKDSSILSDEEMLDFLSSLEQLGITLGA